jgi:putative ABC transport system substrate-binding protein
MDRRTWLRGALGALAAPRAARAQAPAKVFRIGLLAGSAPTSPESAHIWQAFFDGLRDLGYVEGQNVAVEGRFYGDRTDELPALAAELVRLQVDVIVAGAAPAPEAAARATSAIPIVMANHIDPVGSGLVRSLAKPSGNVTGMSLLVPELRGKQLELLKEIVPRLASVAVLADPRVPYHARDVREAEAAARALKLRVLVVEARGPDELAGAISRAARERARAILVLGSSMFHAHFRAIAEMAARSRLPTMSLLKESVRAGALVAYGVDLRDCFRRAAGHVDRILRGARPGDLPVEQPTKFELAVNLRTARALGLTIPRSVLARADQVIE